MKALLYDCPSGISGDMNIGALVDLGVPQEFVRSELARLHLDDEFTLLFEPAQKLGITGTRVTVRLSARRDDTGHRHDHNNAGPHHHHIRKPDHRHYRDIKEMISASPFNERVRTTTGRMFAIIAEAEARIHGIPVDDVSFHEVGATDSIVDIFSAAICLDYLDTDAVFSNPVELGEGFVNCSHGRLPVPAPATLEILKGVPCLTGGVAGEATTPTGAAILKATVQQFGRRFAVTPERIGYGIGHLDFAIPNVLRVVMGEVGEDAVAPHGTERVNVEITANIDDMAPEFYEPLIERLFSAGASDVFITPIIMKKSRLAHMISVLAQEQKVDSLVQVLFEESTTIGVRLHPVDKRMLSRSLVSVPTSFGVVQVKIVQIQGGGARRWKVEYEDVKRLGLKHSVPYLQIHREIEAEVRQYLANAGSIDPEEQR